MLIFMLNTYTQYHNTKYSYCHLVLTSLKMVFEEEQKKRFLRDNHGIDNIVY